MRRALALTLAALIAMCGLVLSVSADPTTTFASLTVNGTDLGDTLVALDAPGVAMELTSAQEQVPDLGTVAAGDEIVVDGKTFVRLDALPRVRYAWDDANVHLGLIVTRAGRQVLDLTAPPPHKELDETRGAYVNYDLLSTSSLGVRGTVDGNATAGADGFVHVSAAMAPEVSVPTAFYEHDDPIRGRRYQAGVTQTVGDSLISSASLIGFTTRHDDGVAPFAMSQARPMFSGIASAPSIADVYVNGHLVKSVPVAPGAYTLGNIPAEGQMGNVNVVLRDTDGHTQNYSAPYAIDASLLRAGATQDSAAIGRTDSGALMFDGDYARGISNRATLSGHLAGSGRTFAGSAGASIMFMPVTAHVALAAVNGRAAGFDASLSIPTRGGSLGIDLMQRSEALAGMSSVSTLGVETRRFSIEFGQRLSPSLDAYASVNGSTFTTSGPSSTTNAGLRLRTGPAAYASVYVENQRSAGFASHTAIAMNFTTSLSHGRSLSANTAAGSAGVEIQQAPKGPQGFSYDARSGVNEQRFMGMEQTSHGNVAMTLDRIYGQMNASLDMMGGIAFAGGHVGFTAPIYGSFALVSVPGVPGAPVYVDQQLAGKTDARGNLFVNGLRQFSSSHISVGYDALPLDVELDKPSIDITPASRGGAIARFKVHRVRTVAGTIVDETGNPPPAYAQMIFEAPDVPLAQTRLDEAGNFIIDDLSPALYHLTVLFNRHACFGTLRVSAEFKLRTDAGRISCSNKVAQR